MLNNYYDITNKNRPYTYSTEVQENTLPPLDAIRGETPPEIKSGFWPCEKNGEFVDVEDHRMRYGDYAQPGTPYWLPLSGDTHGSPARYMQEVGPIPADAVITEPGATAEELFISLRAIRDAKLADTDKMLLSDYPISAEGLVAVKAYRADLRALPDQQGAPWDGGGVETPWPELPKT